MHLRFVVRSVAIKLLDGCFLIVVEGAEHVPVAARACQLINQNKTQKSNHRNVDSTKLADNIGDLAARRHCGRHDRPLLMLRLVGDAARAWFLLRDRQRQRVN